MTRLRRLKKAADEGGPPLDQVEETTFRFLALLYPRPPRHIDERTLEEHPFHELPVEEENANGARVDLEPDHSISTSRLPKSHEAGLEERL